MKCPFCGHENIAGEDTCSSCGEDLASLDVTAEPQSALEAHLLEDVIMDIPLFTAVCVPQGTSLYEVATKMNEQKSGCVLVMDNDTLVGIVSERDILYKAFKSRETDATQITVDSLMTPSPETLNEDDTIAYALNRMSLGGYRHIPILKDEKVVGLLSVQNIFKYVANHLHNSAK